jgi:hypothetical protein
MSNVVMCVVGGWATLWPCRQGLVATEPQIVSGLRFWGKNGFPKLALPFSRMPKCFSAKISGLKTKLKIQLRNFR